MLCNRVRRLCLIITVQKIIVAYRWLINSVKIWQSYFGNKSKKSNILPCVWGSVTNNNGLWIGWLDLLALQLQLQSIITDHTQWLSKTRSISYWTMSVFCCEDQRRIPCNWIMERPYEWITTKCYSLHGSLCRLARIHRKCLLLAASPRKLFCHGNVPTELLASNGLFHGNSFQ
jgi:hypothetical protein